MKLTRERREYLRRKAENVIATGGPDPEVMPEHILALLDEVERRETEFRAILDVAEFTLSGLIVEFRDQTQVVDATLHGSEDVALLEGVRTFSLTIQSSGPQPASPAALLFWLEHYRDGSPLHLTVSR